VPDSCDADLIKRAQRGDAEAVGELYDRYNERIFRYVWARVHDAPTAEDLTGEAFARMVANLASYRFTGVPFAAWLYRIAHNLVVDHHRKEGGRVLIPLQQAEEQPGETANPDSIVDQLLRVERVGRALLYLDPLQREVVVLRFIVGMPLREVARTLDKTVSAVKSLQYRGLIALRTQLKAD
jgi:RNA polymerase sigma-70 factor (ECF subfamily)